MTTASGASRTSPSLAHHEQAEQALQTFQYAADNPGMTIGGGVKKIVKLAGNDHLRVAVQVVKEGGENNLHFHTNTDIVYTVLRGRVRFYGPGDLVYGEFGEHEGLVIPAGARYWFETTGEVPLELFQIFVYTDRPSTAARVNVSEAKAWMDGVAELQIYQNKPG